MQFVNNNVSAMVSDIPIRASHREIQLMQILLKQTVYLGKKSNVR